ncbi:MAG: sugar transferase [Eubacteriales bacterium]
MRASRIDELPQFFNILSGEMSLVGPRARAYRERGVLLRTHAGVPLSHEGESGLDRLRAKIYGKYNTNFDDKLSSTVLYIENCSIDSLTYLLPHV